MNARRHLKLMLDAQIREKKVYMSNQAPSLF